MPADTHATAPAPEAAVETRRVAVIGARGYVGRELLALVAQHPRLSLALAASRSRAGTPVATVAPDAGADLRFEPPDPARVAASAPDTLVLAMPNGAAGGFLAGLARTGATPGLIVDLSADHRFDDGWVYAVPELDAGRLRGAARVANPGCYATAIRLALAPIADDLAGTPCAFGVSGFSGAGAAPNDRNDPDALRGAVLPYALTGHLHEREVSHHLRRPIRFAPAVAPFFRGLVLTLLAELTEPVSADELAERFARFYTGSPLVRCRRDTPRLADVVNTPGAIVGGFSVDRDDPRRVGVVCMIDNLLKGAASGAIQNLNAAMGWPMHEGLLP